MHEEEEEEVKKIVLHKRRWKRRCEQKTGHGEIYNGEFEWSIKLRYKDGNFEKRKKIYSWEDLRE